MPAEHRRATLVGATLGAGIGIALVLLQYTFAMPTSDMRARLRFLFAVAPWSVGGVLFGVLLVAALLAVLLAGWRSRWAYLGAACGAAFTFLLLLSGVFGYLVWAHTEDVSRVGQWARAAGAVVLGGGVLAWGRHVRRAPAAA
jgi:hypothetical protein